MKRALPLLLAVLFVVPLSAAERRSEKRKLIDEVLQLIDAKGFTQDALGRLLTPFDDSSPDDLELPEEERAEYEKARKTQAEQMGILRERLLSRIDYVRVAEEIYVPLFEREFSEDELRELVAFLNTKSGQKLVAVMPDLGIGVLIQGRKLFEEAMISARDELQREAETKDPAGTTMRDMRTLAVALEARATDTNEYPTGDLDSLPPLLAPTYVRQVPLVDAWGTPFVYFSDGMRYRIVSAGADKRFEWNARQLSTDGTPKETESLDADIIFEDGMLIQFPKQDARP